MADRPLQLVMQFLAERGYRDALKALEDQAELKHDPDACKLSHELDIIVTQHDALERMSEDTGSGELDGAQKLELLELGDGKYCTSEAKTIDGLHTSNIICVSVAADAATPWMATGAVDRSITLTDYSSGSPLWRSSSRAASVLCVALHPSDPRRILSGDMNGEVVITRAAVAASPESEGEPEPEPEPEAGTEQPLATFKEHAKYVVRVLWSPSGGRFASASYDRTVCLYCEDDAEGGNGWRLEHKWMFAGTVECILFLSEQSMLVSVRDSHLLFMLDLTDYSRTEINLNPNLDDWVSFTAMDMCLSPNGQFLLVATDKDKMHIYKLGGSDQLRTFFGAENDGFSNPRCLWHPSGLYVYCTGQDNAVHVWEVATQKHVARLTGHSKCVRGLVSGAEGLVTCSYDQTVRLWK